MVAASEFAYFHSVHSADARRDRVASVPPCRLYAKRFSQPPPRLLSVLCSCNSNEDENKTRSALPSYRAGARASKRAMRCGVSAASAPPRACENRFWVVSTRILGRTMRDAG